MKVSNRLTVFFLAGVLAISGAACQRTEEQSVEAAGDAREMLSATDTTFLNDALKSHAEEQAMARLAETQAQNEAVRDYAEMLEQDHSDAMQDVQDLMQDYHATPPADLETARTNATQSLQGLTGAAFDMEFINTMMKNHETAIQKHRQQAASTQNEDVRNYAEDILPTLEKHLEEAKNVQQELTQQR